jgi:DNA polymerase-2
MSSQHKLRGWLLDVYTHEEEGIIVWLLGEDGARYKLRQVFPVAFYAYGPTQHLRTLWQYLDAQEATKTKLERTQRRDLFSGTLDVLRIETPNPAQQASLFRDVLQKFPDLIHYDADIPLALRHAAAHGTFPLAHCQLRVDAQDQVEEIITLDSPWDLDFERPPLRVLRIGPDTEPAHMEPKWVFAKVEGKVHRLSLKPMQQFLISLGALFKHHDPDLILSHWGDTWLFPLLTEYCQREGIEHFNPNRDPGRTAVQREAISYFTYGRVIHRGPQTHLFGRWHIDECNAMMYHDYGLEGTLEQARVTGLPLQEVARKSPGAGITALQMLMALREGILIPHQKQQAERFKTARQLVAADRGGLVGQPLIGLHQDVAEVDFVSMYPSIMVHFNLSPETVGVQSEVSEPIPDLGIPVDQKQRGFVPQTLKPLLEKRIALKARLAQLSRRDCRHAGLEARSQALKWLLVVCFGYLGYKNARFGRIEAHEAVTAYGRESMLSAKEAAEDLGYTVLHMYVDGLWVQKPLPSKAEDIQPLLDEIRARTGLHIALEGIYRWIAFLSSRLDERVPVPNRYFGVFQDGTIKYRGIEARRRDTPPWIRDIQIALLQELARLPDIAQIPDQLPTLRLGLRRHISDLRRQRIPLERLLITQVLSRELEAYIVPSPVARAAAQLQKVGKITPPGRRVRFLFTRGEPGVYAWDLPGRPLPETLDVARYRTLLLRAFHTILQPFGVDIKTLENWLDSQVEHGGRKYYATSRPLLRIS